ncbi:HNH endonuclease [Vibrio fluvialis]|uniref:HNH endonuclease n=1 Tax=Vibrio fluvialis TaxID=676 RepID=UPI002ACA74EF|nr:HNH endonuclease [Vibrio fluvialis]MDZ5516647.1 HNH endonuclease [Vibrio fluvialis]
MKEIQEFLKIFEIPEEEALAALIGSFGPPQASGIGGYWRKHSHFGNKSPSTAVIKGIYSSNDYRCHSCGSQKRLSIDHSNGVATDHSIENLKLLCFSCNRGKSAKPTQDKNHKLKIYKAVMELYSELGHFPTKVQIRQRANVNQIGGATYFLDYMRARLEKNA